MKIFKYPFDILRAEAKWSKKQHRKKAKRQAISQNKWNKKLYRQYQHDTDKNDLFELIPKNTPYCYKAKVLPTNREGIFRYDQEICPFYYTIECPEGEEHIGIVAMNQTHIGGCKLLKKTDDDFQGWGLLWDLCKECGLNYGYGDFQ